MFLPPGNPSSDPTGRRQWNGFRRRTCDAARVGTGGFGAARRLGGLHASGGQRGSDLQRASACARTLSAAPRAEAGRSEEHTSELQSLMRISYAVFCLKKKKKHTNITHS